MKTILRAASVGLLLAAQALPVFADDSGDDATARRAQRFASESSNVSVEATRMSTANSAVASDHISDDAEARRAQRFN